MQDNRPKIDDPYLKIYIDEGKKVVKQMEIKTNISAIDMALMFQTLSIRTISQVAANFEEIRKAAQGPGIIRPGEN